jgi:hypothetical protein
LARTGYEHPFIGQITKTVLTLTCSFQSVSWGVKVQRWVTEDSTQLFYFSAVHFKKTLHEKWILSKILR